MAVVPLKGHFQDWRALLANIMEDDEVERLVILTLRKDGTMMSAHFEMTREQIAFGSIVLHEMALER